MGVQDFTGVLERVRQQTKYPVFVYGGANSHERLSSVVWAYNAMHNEARDGDYLLAFEDKTGVHVPWLNPQPSKGYFFGNLTAWEQSDSLSVVLQRFHLCLSIMFVQVAATL